MDTSLNRRTLIAGAAGALIGTASLTVASAEQPAVSAETRAPLVWLNMTQQELDDAYDQMKYAPNASIVISRYTTDSEETTMRIGEPRRFQYGPTSAEQLDLYPTKQPNAPILIYVHGGAWLSTEAKDYRFPAEAIISAGAHYAVLEFTTASATNGDLMPLADQVRRAVAWVAKNAARFGGDSNRIYICGHSSGGHLGARAI